MSETIGRQLQKAREYRHLTLEKAAEATRIRINYLRALEADDFSSMPSAAQGRGFLNNYAEFLGFDLEKALNDLQKNPPEAPAISGPFPNAEVVPESQPARRIEEPPPAPAIEEIKNEDANPPVEAEPVQGPEVAETDDSKPSLLSTLKSLFNGSVVFRQKEKVEEVTPEEAPLPAPISNGSAEEIFAGIGVDLRKRRESISLTLDEVERHTRVRAVFLKQLENGALDQLPSPVQTRGMLMNYAGFLDMDVDAILLRFADALQARHRQKYPDHARPGRKDAIPSMPPLRSFIAGDLIFGVTMIVVLAGLGIWGILRIMTAQRLENTILPTAPSISDVLAGAPVPTVFQEMTFVPTGGAATQIVTFEAPTEIIDANVQVTIHVVGSAFIRVTEDGKVVLETRVHPGFEKTFTAENQVSILTANAAAIRVTFNGRDLGLMGNFGQVINQVYTAGGLATATATIPPTATATPAITDTPAQTITPLSTPTLETPNP